MQGLVSLVMLLVWELHPIIVFSFISFIWTIEGFYLSATVFKVPQGG